MYIICNVHVSLVLHVHYHVSDVCHVHHLLIILLFVHDACMTHVAVVTNGVLYVVEWVSGANR